MEELRQEEFVELPSGKKVTLKRFSFNDLFLFLRILEKALDGVELDLTNQVDAIRLIARFERAEEEIKALIKSVTNVEEPGELPASDVLFLINEIVKKEKLLDFFNESQKQQNKT